jgi:molecular chaperone DnaK
MSRTTIDFGIDLGTTNSAIAVLKGVHTEIIKNNRDNDITPSAVHVSRKGVLDVGFNAKQRVLQWPDDTFMEFKRRMGSDFTYHFVSSGQKRKAEDLSAEVLKSLKSDVQQKTGEAVDAAVITVPAAFELHQCDATKKAAQLAGFKQHALLQEPVAAALAFGFQADNKKAYWLVYDFGGGTFDAALIKSEDGTIHVVNHGGDNFLGGSDIDWALIEKVIAPRIIEEYGVEQFDRAHAGKGGRWRQAFARLKYAAEQAKIDLSRKDKDRASLDPSYASNLKDEETGEVVVDELDMEISRADLIGVAEPFIQRSIDIAKQVLKEKSLARGDVQKVILVGGPTLAPYFREILAAGLGIPLDYTVDPLTVVARGAAVFAGTQRMNTGVAVSVPAGEFGVDLKYSPVGVDSAPMVGGKVCGGTIKDLTGYAVELVNEKTKWRSGKIPLRADGVFMANLHAERGDRNIYLIELSDPSGRKQKVSPDRIVYTIGAPVDEQPLIHTMGIALANNEYARFFEKGSGLPAKKTRVLRSVLPLRQGQSGEVLRIPVVEGESELADRNRLVGTVEIHATNIRRDLPTGSEVEVTLSVDTSRIIRVKAYCTLLDEEFDTTLDLRKHDPNPEQLSADCDAELKRLQQLKSKACGTGGETAKVAIADAEKNLVEEVKEIVSAAKGDPDAAAKCEKRILELKVRLDEAADALEWPVLVTEARQWLGHLENVIDRCDVTGDQERKAAQLKSEVEEIIAQKKMDRLRKKREQVESLYWEIVFAQDGFWIDCFGKLEKDKQRISDRVRGDRLFDQGRQCIENNNINGVRSVVTQLWDLLPKEVVEAAQRGYQSGLI